MHRLREAFGRVRMIDLIILVLGIVALGAVSAGLGAWWALDRVLTLNANAPILHDVDAGPAATQIFDRQNEPAFTLYTEQRIDVPLAQLSKQMVQAVLAAEDARFYAHPGIDPVRVAGAAVQNIRSGRIEEGASTITQQLVRLTSLTPERTWNRKVRELFLALQAETRWTKEQILEAYLNRVYLGEGYYGVEAAARGYLGKSASALDAAEGALIAGLIRAPSALAPTKNPDGAGQRRNQVLAAMRELDFLDDAGYETARAAPIVVEARQAVVHEHSGPEGRAGYCGMYFREEVRRVLIGMYGEDRTYEGGLRVYTTLDPRLQGVAERVVSERVQALRRGRGPAHQTLQGSVVAMEPRTGRVLAIVGGRDFHESPFNRATQARRQPGSAFKPLIFAAALERGYTPATVLDDLSQPIPTAEGPWRPDDEHAANSYTLRRALTVSSNRAAARLLHDVGISSTLDLAQRLGIASRLPAVPSLALGSGEVTLMELTAAYAAFANEGLLAEPHTIRRIEARDGRVIYEHEEQPTRVVSDATAFLISSMLRDVIDRGTAQRARREGFSLPAAGKTGTTNEFADAWFVGYTPKIVAGVWFGLDEPAPIMRRGFASVVAVPAWAEFMLAATRDDGKLWYDTPEGMVTLRVCAVSGLRATDECGAAARYAQAWEPSPFYPEEPRPAAGVVEDYFTPGTAPTRSCDLHAGWQPPVRDPSLTAGAADALGTLPADGWSSPPAMPVWTDDPVPTTGSEGADAGATPVVAPTGERELPAVAPPPLPRVREVKPPAKKTVPPLPTTKPPASPISIENIPEPPEHVQRRSLFLASGDTRGAVDPIREP